MYNGEAKFVCWSHDSSPKPLNHTTCFCPLPASYETIFSIMYETYKAYIPTAGDSTVFISAYYDYHYHHNHNNHNHYYYYYMYAKNLLVSYTFCTR